MKPENFFSCPVGLMQKCLSSVMPTTSWVPGLGRFAREEDGGEKEEIGFAKSNCPPVYMLTVS